MFSTINYWPVIIGAFSSMIVGYIWYGPLFGKKWMEIVGVSPEYKQTRAEMQKSAGPLYFIQFILTLFQILVLAHLIADASSAGGLERSLWVWSAFVIPTLAGTIMWTNNPNKVKLAQFLIQGGYQLLMFVIYGFLLQYWK